MDNQQSDKNYEKIFDLIKEGLNKKTQEKNNKRQLEYHIKELGDLLNEMIKKVQEKINLPEIEGSRTIIDLYCHRLSNEPIWCEYNIKTYIYSKDKVIMCHSDTQNSPYKIECTHYSGRSFDLSDLLQNIYFIQGIRISILDIYDILKPRVLNNLDKRYIHIRSVVYMNLNKPIKENPKISKNSNKFEYNNGRYYIEIMWLFYDRF
jgi:hypothetical protein